jgi:ribosomal protein L11 methyltransferase
VLAALLELAPAGVEQVDGDGFVEYALYGAPGELPAFPEGDAEVGGVRVRVRGEPVADDWAERWKQFHEPVLVEAGAERSPAGERPPAERPPGAGRPPADRAPSIWVRPPWAAPRQGALDLVIDPGQAFGTGAHPTTRLCLELMLGLEPPDGEPRGSFADLGCGSGVLAIAAALLGFGPVTAVDNEVAALDATRDNATANGVRLDRLERVNLREESPPDADTVAANLVRPLLLDVAGRVERRPAALILSGLLDEEADEVAAEFARALFPLAERERRSAHGWTAVLLR